MMATPIPGVRPEGYGKTFWGTISESTAKAFRAADCNWDLLPEDQRNECIRAHNKAMQQSYNESED
ncbi:MAG: hypothetical protein WCV58_03490 [Patescibacteria group bacterium]